MSTSGATQGNRPGPGGPAGDDRDRRGRVAIIALALLSTLFFAGAIASAINGGSLFGNSGDEDDERRAAGLPPGWASLDPLLPLAPSLRDMSDMRRDAADRPSRVLRGEGGGGIRLRERPSPADPDGGRRVAPSVARVRLPRVSVPSTGIRPVATVTRLVRPITDTLGDVGPISVPDFNGLPGVPTIDPLPGGVDNPLPGGVPQVPGSGPAVPGAGPAVPGGIAVPGAGPAVPGGIAVPGAGPAVPGGIAVPGAGPAVPGAGTTVPGGILQTAASGSGTARTAASSLQATTSSPLEVAVLDAGTDPAFDALLVSSGDQVLERYTFRDSDIAGLAMQMNLRSRLLVADPLPGSTTALDHVVGASVASGGPAAAAGEQGAGGSGDGGRAGSDARTAADSGGDDRGGSGGTQSAAGTSVSSQSTESRGSRSATTSRDGARRAGPGGDTTGGSSTEPRSRGSKGGGSRGEGVKQGRGPKAGRGASKPRRSAGRSPDRSSRRGEGRKPQRGGGSQRGNGRGADKSDDDDEDDDEDDD